MGEMRIVNPGKTRGYPYPACKKEFSSTAKKGINCVSQVRKSKKIKANYARAVMMKIKKRTERNN